MLSQPVLLVVDDVLSIRQLVQRAAQRATPYALIVDVPGVTEALDANDQIHLTAILTDYHLPDGTGLDVLAHAHSKQPGIPIAVMSSDYDVEPAAHTAGATCFCPKPIEIPAMFALLKLLLPPPDELADA